MGNGPLDRDERRKSRTRALRVVSLALAANVLLLLLVCSEFLSAQAFDDAIGGAWMVAVYLTYPVWYLAPAALLALLGERAIRRLARGARGRLVSVLAWTPAVLAFGTVQLVLYADRRVHALYGFHLNGFVWNLVTTRGGIESMGAGTSSRIAAVALAAGLAVVEIGVVGAAARIAARGPTRWISRRAAVAIVAAFALVSCGERLGYSTARLFGYRPVLAYGDAFPFYLRSSFSKIAHRFGIGIDERRQERAALREHAMLTYPLRAISFRADAPRWNVVVLCSESLRADALDPDIMPATWQFASGATRFTAHVSSGNGTRLGVFGLFYGLPGPYWFRFLDLERGPVLLDALQQRGYDVRAFTSALFSYPEFDRTVFANTDPTRLHEERTGRSWERDRAQADDILRFLAERDPAQPFFLYAFFESPHAPYEFPPETAFRKPYLADLDYVTMDLQRDIGLIQNRYWNSVRHLDTQLARVFAALAERGLLDSTIVIVTGDHGEEFLEHGRWGHNSAFSERQIRTPLVVRVPGRAPAVVDRVTSHLDVAPTLLEALGAENPPSDYALGTNLFAENTDPHALVSDWSRLAYVDATGKATFPTRRVAFFQRDVADRRDAPLADADAWLAAHAGRFTSLLADLGRFTSRSSAQHRPANSP